MIGLLSSFQSYLDYIVSPDHSNQAVTKELTSLYECITSLQIIANEDGISESIKQIH